jgi:PHD/YefM family antitoxin component YafN of YafNO toxin-antitoxin module
MLFLGIATQNVNSTKEEILTKKNNTPAAILIKAAKTVLK